MRSTILCLLCFASLASADEYIAIRGQVKWNDTKPPVIQALNLNRPGAVVFPTDTLVDAKSLGFANVIVWLRPDTNNRKDAYPADKIKPELRKPKTREHVIYSVDDEYVPRIVAAQARDTLKISNVSERTVNVNYMSDAEQVNPILKPGEEFSLKKPLSVQIAPIHGTDNIAPWKEFRMRVFDHPYFAVTDKDGKFEIKDAPAGKWRIVYWHEHGFHQGRQGIFGFPIELKADTPGGTTMELKPLAFEIVKPKP